MKLALEAIGWLAAASLLIFASHSVLAQGKSTDVETAPAQQQRTRRTQSEDVDATPTSIMRGARTLYISQTKHLDKTYLVYKLQKQAELREWDLMLVDNESVADLVIQFEKTALNYIFTIVDPRTRAIVASGKTVAINGLVAAENLGREIIKKIRDVRAGTDNKSRKKKNRKDDDEDDWSES
jgi:hypothetical protein